MGELHTIELSELSEAIGPPLPRNPLSPWEKFLKSVQDYPEYLAVASVHQKHDLFGIPSIPLEDNGHRSKNAYLRWTYRSLLQGVSQFAAGLKSLGVKPGMPIFSFQPNGVEYLLAL
jgi:acyl-CoA synthetase (AMP-forming)/AMP-acid ligase II